MKCLSLVEIFFSFLLFSIGIFFVCENVLLNLRRKLREDRLHSSGNTKVNFVFHSLALSLSEKTPRRQATLVVAFRLPGKLMISSSKGNENSEIVVCVDDYGIGACLLPRCRVL